MKDLGGIEPPKSFRNAGDSVPYDDIEQSDKLKFEYKKASELLPMLFILRCYRRKVKFLSVMKLPML